jgi:hypothetical protein
MILRERSTDQGLLVAVCDEDVLGETFENGEVSITVNEEFYGGDPVEADDVVDSLTRANVANIVGVRAVEVAIEAGIIDDTHVLEIGETRHAQLVRI